MRAVAALVALYVVGIPAFGQERPDPTKNEWLMKCTVGLTVVDGDEAAEMLKKIPGATATKRKGVFVKRVRPLSPAETSKLKPLDLIVSVDGKPVETPEEFQAIIEASKPLTALRVSVKAFENGPKWPMWKSAQNLKPALVTFENGRMARESVIVNVDPVSRFGTVTVKTHPRVAGASSLYLLFVINNEGFAVNPRVRAVHHGKDFVFAETVTVRAGEQVHRLPILKDTVERKPSKSADTVFESCDWPFADKARDALLDSITAKPSIVQFSGMNAPANHTLTEEEQAFSEIMLDAYNSLRFGNVFNVKDR